MFFFRTEDKIIQVKSVGANYLSVEELGAVLCKLSHTFPGTYLDLRM